MYACPARSKTTPSQYPGTSTIFTGFTEDSEGSADCPRTPGTIASAKRKCLMARDSTRSTWRPGARGRRGDGASRSTTGIQFALIAEEVGHGQTEQQQARTDRYR